MNTVGDPVNRDNNASESLAREAALNGRNETWRSSRSVLFTVDIE